MRWLAVIAVLSCGACQYVPGTQAAIERQAREQITPMLTDPESLQLADVAKSADGSLICGRMNSRNRMGGYVGFEGFVMQTSGEERIWLESSEWPTGGYSRTLHRVYLEQRSKCAVGSDAEAEALNSSDRLADDADRLEAMAANVR